jgi:hypothetical protein
VVTGVDENVEDGKETDRNGIVVCMLMQPGSEMRPRAGCLEAWTDRIHDQTRKENMQLRRSRGSPRC